MEVVDPANNWLDTEAAPAIRSGIASVARRPLQPHTFDQWPDVWQEAFQNAAINVWRSTTARHLVATGAWDELRRFAHRAGSNAAIDILRHHSAEERRLLLGTDQPKNEPILDGLPAYHTEQPEQVILGQDYQRELQALLQRLQALLPELPESVEHPQRTILGLRLHLIEQEVRAQPSESAAPPRACDPALDSASMREALSPTDAISPSPNPHTQTQIATTEDPLWGSWVHVLLGSPYDLPLYRELRLDVQIADILRPALVSSPEATSETRRQAAQWVRTEISRGRQRLRTLYERRYSDRLAW